MQKGISAVELVCWRRRRVLRPGARSRDRARTGSACPAVRCSGCRCKGGNWADRIQDMLAAGPLGSPALALWPWWQLCSLAACLVSRTIRLISCRLAGVAFVRDRLARHHALGVATVEGMLFLTPCRGARVFPRRCRLGALPDPMSHLPSLRVITFTGYLLDHAGQSGTQPSAAY